MPRDAQSRTSGDAAYIAELETEIERLLVARFQSDLWPKFCPCCMAAFHADGTVTPFEASADSATPTGDKKRCSNCYGWGSVPAPVVPGGPPLVTCLVCNGTGDNDDQIGPLGKTTGI